MTISTVVQGLLGVILTTSEPVALTNLKPGLRVDKSVIAVNELITGHLGLGRAIDKRVLNMLVQEISPTGEVLTVQAPCTFNSEMTAAKFSIQATQLGRGRLKWLEGAVIRLSFLINDGPPTSALTEDIHVVSKSSAKLTYGGPWGVAVSYTSGLKDNLWWKNAIRAAGVDWVRGFDRRHGRADAVLSRLHWHGFKLSGFLEWSSGDGFPDEDIKGWNQYINKTLAEAKGRVQHWEVWNEPPNFTEDKDPAHYAKILRSAYTLIKKKNPEISVGIAGQSVNLAFLSQAISKGGAGYFDYLTLHPYETMALVQERGFESMFMSITSATRKMLEAHNPAKRNIPIIFTELGVAVEAELNGLEALPVSIRRQKEIGQSAGLIKAFVLSLAQGVTRVHWFEPTDSEQQSLGLLSGSHDNAQKRPAYRALRTLIRVLGEKPKYVGWVELSRGNYGFIFEEKEQPIMIAWGRPKRDSRVSFRRKSRFIDPLTGKSTFKVVGYLGRVPMIAVGISDSWVAEAVGNRDRPFPWDGDYSQAAIISVTEGEEHGLHLLKEFSWIDIEDNLVLDMSDHQVIRFAVDPNFLLYDAKSIRITAVVKSKSNSSGSTNKSGFNLAYEQPEGIRNHKRGWYNVPDDNKWHEVSWDIDDPMFVGLWGYNFWIQSDAKDYSQYYLKSVRVEKRI